MVASVFAVSGLGHAVAPAGTHAVFVSWTRDATGTDPVGSDLLGLHNHHERADDGSGHVVFARAAPQNRRAGLGLIVLVVAIALVAAGLVLWRRRRRK